MALVKMEYMNGFALHAEAGLLDAIPHAALEFTLWGILPVAAIMMLPYMAGAIAMFLAILRGKTPLPKWMCILNPLAAKVLLNAVAVLAPNTAFSNGLEMANMALGGMIPFLGILVWLCAKRGEGDVC